MSATVDGLNRSRNKGALVSAVPTRSDQSVSPITITLRAGAPRGQSIRRADPEPAAATEQKPAARLEGTALFPRLRRLNPHQNPAETLHIRRLENGR
jgi:hypothetical protein